MILQSLLFAALLTQPKVRSIAADTCEITRINLALGMTTQLIFDFEPKLTLFADKDHFQIQGTKEAPRVLAIIPLVRNSEIRELVGNKNHSIQSLVSLVDSAYKTNLFVFFSHGQEFMFDLRFVPKEAADFAVRIKRRSTGKCDL